MMGQRKLTDEELQVVMDARFHVRQVAKFSNHAAHFHESLRRLDEMANNGTTDGKPWTEPEPPIPDGYRRAVKGDEGREDCILWSSPLGKWIDRPCMGESFTNCDRYAVPVDRVPTDADAKSRPVVMVRDHDTQKWEKETLIFVRNCEHSKYKFATTDKAGAEIICWKQCRHLYPNETP